MEGEDEGHGEKGRCKVGWLGGRGRGGSLMNGSQGMSAWEGRGGIGCGVRGILHPYQEHGIVGLGHWTN